MKYLWLALVFLSALLMQPVVALSQTDLRITGAQQGFPIAVPRLCDVSGAIEESQGISDFITKNLDFTGLFVVLNSSSYVETPGKCGDQVVFTDWSYIGAEFLIKGEVERLAGDRFRATLKVFDVQQKRPVIGKEYKFSQSEVRRVANRFSNEVVRFFTGTSGIFGSKIAYVSRVGRFKEVFVMNLDGSEPIQLTRHKGLAITPSWSPSGDRVIYTSFRTRKPELYTVSPNGGGTRQVTKREGTELGAVYSSDGTQILASATSVGVSNIVLFDLKGRMLRSLTQSGSIDISPSWSPDGKEIAFCSNRAGGPQIYSMSSQGERAARPRRLSYTKSSYCTSPAWSPDGKWIAFVCRNNGFQLYIVDPSGREVRQLTFAGNNEDPAWSPDSRYIIFSSDFGRREPKNLALLPLSTGQVRQLTNSKVELSQPAWSPVYE